MGPVGSMSKFKAQKGGANYGGQFSAWVSTRGGLDSSGNSPGASPPFAPVTLKG